LFVVSINSHCLIVCVVLCVDSIFSCC